MPNLPYSTSGWTTHSEVSKRVIDYPLAEEEPTHFTVTRTYEGPVSTYAGISLDAADAEFSAAKFVRQGRLVDIGGSCIRYEREWATVPAQWSALESFAFIFPAYLPGTPGTSYSVTGITVGSGTLLLSTLATGISAGDAVQAAVRYTRGAVVYQQTLAGKATAAVSGVSVTLPGALLGAVGAPSSVTGSIAKTSVGRTAAEPLTVGSRLVHDYALSSLSALNTDLPLQQQFRAVDSTGAATDSLTASTSPTSSAYASLVGDGTEIVAEASIRRRYRGNIYVRSTRLVPAT